MSDIAVTDHIARDLMSTEVMTVQEGWSIARLAEFFLTKNITGAPVVSAAQKLVGVVSMSDIFKFENASEQAKSDALKACYREATGRDIASRADLAEWSKNAQDNCTVNQIMAGQVISVEADRTIPDIAKILIDNDIHRVFVIENERVVGVITSSDILRPLLGGV